mmetsp:Transcript_96418/g.269801  ORF Transcript_96418/g.269801 Transcript_96418/m.269801 type:complete len:210 (-) Transcript_96418:244-873(-)
MARISSSVSESAALLWAVCANMSNTLSSLLKSCLSKLLSNAALAVSKPLCSTALLTVGAFAMLEKTKRQLRVCDARPAIRSKLAASVAGLLATSASVRITASRLKPRLLVRTFSHMISHMARTRRIVSMLALGLRATTDMVTIAMSMTSSKLSAEFSTASVASTTATRVFPSTTVLLAVRANVTRAAPSGTGLPAKRRLNSWQVAAAIT